MRLQPDSLIIDETSLDKKQNLEKNLIELRIGQLALVSTRLIVASKDNIVAGFRERPDYQKGRHNSINCVSFHDMTIQRSSTPTLTQPVAIKPYISNSTAARDFNMMRYINNHPSLPRTFEPIGFMRLDNGEISTITEFNQGVTSCDTFLHRFNNKQIPEEDIRLMLNIGLVTLKSLHNNKITHGDLQIKNTAFDASMSPRIIDTETMRIRTPDESSKFQFIRDVSNYIYSVEGEYNLEGRNTAIPEIIVEYLINPYLEDVNNIFPVSLQHSITDRINDIKQDLLKS